MDSDIDAEERVACDRFTEEMRCDAKSLLGRLVDEVGRRLLSHKGLISGIQHAPDTWLPALMLECVRQGYIKTVFLPSGASTMVRQLEEREGFDKERPATTEDPEQGGDAHELQEPTEG